MAFWIRGLAAVVALGLLACAGGEDVQENPYTMGQPSAATGGPSDGPGPGPGAGPNAGPGPGPSGGPSDGPTTGPSDGPTTGPSDGPSDGPGPGPSDGPGPGPSDGPVGPVTRNPDFIDLSPPLGEPFDPASPTALTPAAPAGWDWYPVADTKCRDGSGLGVFVHFSDAANKLLIYFEGGGACTTGGFCNFNPPNVDMALGGDGQTALGSAVGAVVARQQPGVFAGGIIEGMFDLSNAKNPFKDWNMVYIPYCSGDVHFGTRENVTVPSSAGLRADMPKTQNFLGALNTKKIVSRVVPTFSDVDHVIVTGASAGSFGAMLNFSMISDAFGGVRVDAIGDSGVPFSDEYWPVCLQKSWRELWGFNDAFPPDCDECFAENGGGFINISDFLLKKHPDAHIGIVSSMEDDVIRLFFSPGQNDCATVETADPVAIALGLAHLPAATYTAALNDFRMQYGSTGQLATYFIGGANIINHQHMWRNRFYDTTITAGGKSIADWTTGFLAGEVEQVGP